MIAAFFVKPVPPGPARNMVEHLRRAMMANLSRGDSWDADDFQNSPSHAARCCADSSLGRANLGAGHAEPAAVESELLTPPSRPRAESDQPEIFEESEPEALPQRKSALRKRPAASVPNTKPKVAKSEAAAVSSGHHADGGDGEPDGGDGEGDGDDGANFPLPLKKPAAAGQSTPPPKNKGESATARVKMAKKPAAGSTTDAPTETTTLCPNADYSYKDESGVWQAWFVRFAASFVDWDCPYDFGWLIFFKKLDQMGCVSMPGTTQS